MASTWFIGQFQFQFGPKLDFRKRTVPDAEDGKCAGHMKRALGEMQLMVQSQRVDLIIETRDARMPLTSINPAFERLLHAAGGQSLNGGMTKRLIVYNKSDLAQDCFREVGP